MINEKKIWEKILIFFQKKFNIHDTINLDGMMFLIGVNELGKGFLNFNKDDKLNLIHIAVCRLLEPFGFYKFEGLDKEGWPVYTNIEKIPYLKSNEQTLLIKKAIIYYFEKEKLLDY